MSSEMDDRHLVAEFLRTRKESVFRKLYQTHSPRLYLFVLRLCGGRSQEAEDILQEVWIRAIRNLAGFSWISTLHTWLSGIAINCYREHTSRSRDSENLESVVGSLQNDPGLSLDLESLLARLPSGCREVLVLHDVEGYTHDEIGGLLGIQAGTSKSQLFEARKKMREWLSARQAVSNTSGGIP